MTEAQNRALINQRRRAVAAVRGRQTWAGAWLPLAMILVATALAAFLKFH